jgi:hypothetical protein
MQVHRLKSWSYLFDAIKAGRKLADIRKNDRNYRVGDRLELQRYDNIDGAYTGEELNVEVTHIINADTPCAFSSHALAPGYSILSIKVIA